ncbi:HTH-type transcriptional repressor KstR2 [Mycobacterium basiliense]|uniref:HTH-type transcriptional repressor KstR2 n=1 Tax=Mycobacterium basiliense TaxID=2094119 RepID=A0A447GIA9_9MYCO|nr:TetR/AcrR family transcriptional regulator [Mycobacterium basiliense]VDM90193.1 HTH-type transcriptional repressor KstR2 [Mycobacterium basiliense]
MAKADVLGPGRRTAARGNHAGTDSGTRRTEILQTAASLIASSGLRTSLQEIADAAGILPGSLYHHFESKEAILIELIRRYQQDLERIGHGWQEKLDQPDSRPVSEKINELGTAIAHCAVQHRAALQMSFYEGPSADPELMQLTRQRPLAIQEAMLQTLRAARWSGYIKPQIDLPTLADRICQTMLQVGLDVMRRNASTEQVSGLMCRIILEGLATREPLDGQLDPSPALAAANKVIETWTEDQQAEPGDKAAHVLAIARMEFGRRGYEATTIRDIASAAGLGTGTVYRVIGSKDELLASIMRSFGQKVEAGWVSVLRSTGTPIEKLDALSWVNINALDQFSDEFRIQLAWMRQSPPDTPNPGWLYSARLRQMKSLLSEGLQSDDIRIEPPSITMLARCIIGLQWIPENILHAIGTRPALLHARDTVLRGAAVRSD